MRPISTDGRHLSTDGSELLQSVQCALYRLPMIDIKLASNFGDLLDRMLRSREISIQGVMEELECSRAMVDKYRRNGSKPAAAKLKKFADLRGYSYTDLLKLTHGKDVEPDIETPYYVKTERGALVGRIFENLDNDQIRAAVFELLTSLAREPQKKQG